MPCPKSIVSMLCTVLLMSAVIVSAHPYFSESSYLEGVFNRRNDMNALSIQAGQTCPMSGACEVCQTTQIGSRDLHICPGDGDRCNPTPCVYTSVCRCSSRTLQLPSNLLKCNSNTTAVIEGVPVKINIIEYAVITPGPDPDFTCFTTEPFIDTCTKECNSTCGYHPEPDCSINQNIYFLLDGTQQNYAFCTFGITIHMLVAAFNPGSSTSGTRLSTVLFPRNNISNVVFGTSNSCDEIKSKIPVLQTQMQTCQDINQTDKSSITYKSLCGSATTAVNGLNKILSLIPNPASTPSAVVILTDGQIDDSDSERNRVLNSLANPNLKVQTIISGGITGSGATNTTLNDYNRNNFANDGFVLTNNAVSLGVGLVRKMESVRLICPELANEIVEELENVQKTSNGINNYCQCHNIRVLDALDKKNEKCVVTYPKCGGSLSTGAKAQPKQQESLSYLEEEILAAIENVMERFED